MQLPPRLLVTIDRTAAGVPLGRCSAWPESWRDTGGRIAAYGEARGAGAALWLPGVALYSTEGPGSEAVATPEAGVRDDLVVDAFHRSVLPLFLQHWGMEVLHASAVDRDGAAVALCAESGTGKSTLAAALATRGLPLVADDAVAIEPGGERPMTEALPFSLRLSEESRRLIAELGGMGDVEVARRSGETNLRLPLVAVVVLHRDGSAEPRLERLTPTAAFTALLTHAYAFTARDAERNRRMAEHYLDLAARVPVFAAHFGDGPAPLAGMAGLIAEPVAPLDR